MTALQQDITMIVAEINAILVKNAGLGIDDVVIDGSATLEELGLDSLAGAELQAVLESRHGVTIPDDAVGLTVVYLASLVHVYLPAA
jgi:acyl carrier protein